MISEALTLSVVIVNFRTPGLVIDCLATLLPELKEINARVIIVDNNSNDGSADCIQEWITKNDANEVVLLVPSATNAGFSSGNNIGINALKANHYLLLNSDTLVRPGAIKILLDTANAYPGDGLISPRLEWPDGVGQESCFRFHSPASELSGAAQTGLIDWLLKRYIVPLTLQSEVTHPQWTSFACVLIKDEVFQQVGLLDESFFMYFEDAEFCHRARKAGWDIVNQPEAHIVHLRGGSSPVKEFSIQKKRLPDYYYESRTLLFYKTHGWMGLTIANLLWEAGRLLSKTRQVLGRADKAAIEFQWLDIWTNWLAPMKSYTHPDSGR